MAVHKLCVCSKLLRERRKHAPVPRCDCCWHPNLGTPGLRLFRSRSQLPGWPGPAAEEASLLREVTVSRGDGRLCALLQAEQLGPSGAQSDEDASQPATGQGLNVSTSSHLCQQAGVLPPDATVHRVAWGARCAHKASLLVPRLPRGRRPHREHTGVSWLPPPWVRPACLSAAAPACCFFQAPVIGKRRGLGAGLAGTVAGTVGTAPFSSVHWPCRVGEGSIMWGAVLADMHTFLLIFHRKGGVVG